MKILTGPQIKAADQYTIEHEPIDSLALMERASETIAQWICNHVPMEFPLVFLIGKGNNGGDGLAVARMLFNVGYNCTVYCLYDKQALSEECRYNLERLPKGLRAKSFQNDEKSKIASLSGDTVIIDAILGTGVSGELTEPTAGAVKWINEQQVQVISIDLPSGMKTEYGNTSYESIVKATTTLTLEFPKLALLTPEAGELAGTVEILPIELSSEFIEAADSPYFYVTEDFASGFLKPRPAFGHKGTFGHAFLICGSTGMAGAAVLATGAALRSGCGLVTVHLPAEERFAIHTTNPSALVSGDPMPYFSVLPTDMEKYGFIGVGPGLGNHHKTAETFGQLLELCKAASKPMVLDADAINILAEHPQLQGSVPAHSVLTPHPGELERVVGKWESIEQRNEKAIELSTKLKSYVIVKGAHTMICTPDGKVYFNSTGNAGMAKGGSGDILTGLITGLMARGYQPGVAAMLGVYFHGKAADRAAEYYGEESMNSSDIIDFIQL